MCVCMLVETNKYGNIWATDVAWGYCRNSSYPLFISFISVPSLQVLKNRNRSYQKNILAKMDRQEYEHWAEYPRLIIGWSGWLSGWLSGHFFSKNLMIEELPNPNQSTKPLCFNLWAMGLRSWQLAIVLAQKLARCSPPNDLETVHHIITHQSLCHPDLCFQGPRCCRDVTMAPRHPGFHQSSDLPRIIHEETKVVRILSACRSPRLPHTPHISPYSCWTRMDQVWSMIIIDHPCQYCQSGLWHFMTLILLFPRGKRWSSPC